MTSKLSGAKSSANKRANNGSMLSASLSVGTTTENRAVLVIAVLGRLRDVDEQGCKDRKLVVSGNLIKCVQVIVTFSRGIICNSIFLNDQTAVSSSNARQRLYTTGHGKRSTIP
jgi:hypothetical protein